MSVDLSEFYPKATSKCLISRLVDLVEEAEKEKILAALDEPTVSNYAIVRWFRARELVTTDSSVSTHRKKRCRCE